MSRMDPSLASDTPKVFASEADALQLDGCWLRQAGFATPERPYLFVFVLAV